MHSITRTEPLPRLTPFEKIEEIILSDYGLQKFKEYEHHNPDFSLDEFFERLPLLNSNYVSVNATTEFFECRQGARRSLVDVYRLAKYYVPAATFNDVLKSVKARLDQGFNMITYCCDIHRAVIHLNFPSNAISDVAKYMPNEFGYEGLEEMFDYLTK